MDKVFVGAAGGGFIVKYRSIAGVAECGWKQLQKHLSIASTPAASIRGQ